jgi:hypothetical protein
LKSTTATPSTRVPSEGLVAVVVIVVLDTEAPEDGTGLELDAESEAREDARPVSGGEDGPDGSG